MHQGRHHRQDRTSRPVAARSVHAPCAASITRHRLPDNIQRAIKRATRRELTRPRSGATRDMGPSSGVLRASAFPLLPQIWGARHRRDPEARPTSPSPAQAVISSSSCRLSTLRTRLFAGQMPAAIFIESPRVN
ncbi:hypothetical protein SCP_1800590 [Sparassis crispa]|uniref:Uncharacterized protein n=1 Tax=Sparassis crispa TaxID=139825 RepID=A0A401H6H0_9APHY|nr:hypothetical protein SCP_1800590 [Sparassis crispa]GBE90037.1 hypothetical protein SCP_1800590 [Sparassis crispa]